MQIGDDIAESDTYSDSDSRLELFKAGKPLKRVRAVIHWASNVGYSVHMPWGLLNVALDPETGNYVAHIPERGP